jgi:hypothetical protein
LTIRLVDGGAGLDEGAVVAHEQDQGAADVEGQDWHGDGGNEAPDDEGVPLPLPDGVDQAQGVVAEMLELLAVHGEAAGVEEVDAELDEGDEQEQVERGDGVRADLRGNLVEAERPGKHHNEDRGEADGGVDADDHAEGQTPGEAARGDAAAELAQQRTEDSAAQELAEGLRDEHMEMVRPVGVAVSDEWRVVRWVW